MRYRDEWEILAEESTKKRRRKALHEAAISFDQAVAILQKEMPWTVDDTPDGFKHFCVSMMDIGAWLRVGACPADRPAYDLLEKAHGVLYDLVGVTSGEWPERGWLDHWHEA